MYLQLTNYMIAFKNEQAKTKAQVVSRFLDLILVKTAAENKLLM